MDLDTYGHHPEGPIYFSLDGAFRHPIESDPAQSGTAARNCFSGADVLVQATQGAEPVVYATAEQLGLSGDDQTDWSLPHDDVDALALWDNGNMIFEPGVDKIMFSVRTGSEIISLSGGAIEEGDVLTIPAPGETMPTVVVHAEVLGSHSRRNGCTGNSCGELDALDLIAGKDRDGDGLNDLSEAEFYGTDPTVVDTDGDGMSDYEEALASTDSLDPSSFLAFSVITRVADGKLLLAWPSRSGRTYAVDEMHSLFDPPAMTLGPYPGTPPTNEVEIVPILDQGFYRLRVGP
jgi:hypothetical protein